MWTCPVCFQVPRKEIYNCSIGHSICGTCKLRLTTCPTCRAPLLTTRNFATEELLDQMSFECPWKERGCLELLKREDLPIHDEFCKNGLFFLCGKFTHFTKCDFRSGIPHCNNEAAVSALLDHMNNDHGCPTRRHCSYGMQVHVTLNICNLKKLAETQQIKTLSHVFLDFSKSNTVNKSIPTRVTIMVVNRVHLINQSRLILSWSFVALTFIKDLSKFSVRVSFTNKENTTLTTRAKLIHASDFRKYLDQTGDEKNYCPQSVVLGDSQNIYTSNEGLFKLSYFVENH